MGLNLFRRLQANEPERPLGGRYKIISKLGAGGFGQTFLAEDLHLPDHPRCVVKQLQPQVSDADSLQTARRLFDTEAKVLYKLGSHDQIPRLMAHFEDSQEFYLVQEFVDGAPLSEELTTGQPWSEAKVVALLQDILQALAFVHDEHVIHRDIKPPNLMRRRQDGKIVLIDFGAVKQVSTQITNPKAGQTNLTISIGTQGYMPNEQLGGTPRFSSDLYAVGMIGIQALTGIHPRHLGEDPRTGEIQWRDRIPQVTPELANFLDRLTRYDFRARYVTATEALEALQTLPAELLQAAAEISAEMAIAPSSGSDALTATATAPTVAVNPLPNVHVSSNTADTLASGADPTATLPAPTPAKTSVPTLFVPGPTQLQPQKAWPILAVIVAVGATFFIAKMLFTAQPTPQTAQQPSSTSSSSNASPAPQASTSTASSPTSNTPAVSSPSPNNSQPTSATSATAPSPAQPAIAPLLAEAESLRTAKQPEKALALYEQAIAQDANNAEAQWGRCYSLNQLQRAGEALTACDKAIAINPKSAEALWSKGYALDQLKRHEEAIAAYDQAIAIKPNYAEAWSNKGSSLLLLNRPSEAIAAFDKATALKPDLAEAWNNRGVALWNMRRFDEAIASIDKALQIQPDYSDARTVRETMRQQLGY